MGGSITDAVGAMKRYLPILGIAILFLLAWGFDLYHYLSLDSLRQHHQHLSLWVALHPVFSIVIFMSLYMTIVGLALPVATVLTLSGGFFFGQWLGTAVVVISATFGASLIFFSIRLASKPRMIEPAASWMKTMHDGFQKNAWSYLLMLRLMPIFPFFAINIGAALLQVPFQTFFWGTLFGIIPGTFVYVSMGVALHEVINQPELSAHLVVNPKVLIALGGLGVISLFPVFYQRFKKCA
jgi:uncharacterized membrane protein YdjX (TVP38/TMEM64 family)